MTNQRVLVLYAPLLIVTSILFVSLLARERKNRLVRQSIFMNAMLLCWQICEMLLFLLPTQEWVRYVYDLKMALMQFMALSIFLVISSFYRIDRRYPRWLPALLCIVPATTALLALTSPLHSLILSDFTIMSLQPLIEIQVVRGVYFYLHMSYTSLLIVGIGALTLSYFLRLPAAYRDGSLLLFATILMYLSSNGLDITGIFGNAVDYNLFGASICSIFIYFATVAINRYDFMRIQRSEVFEYLDEAIYILDADGRTVDYNMAARNLVRLLDAQDSVTVFPAFLQSMIDGGRIVRRHVEGADAEDLFILGVMYPLVYSMRSQPIFNRGSQMIGRYIILTDVTNNRLSMERLRETAGVDALTGLPNRYRYQQLLRDLDAVSSLPLSIIMGDVNGLKTVNDTFGHYEGDLLLKAVADVLKRCCPPDGHVARIGGDEFMLLLPNCPASAVGVIIDDIHMELGRIPALSQIPSIALGSATKTVASENINTLIGYADKMMYVDKG